MYELRDYQKEGIQGIRTAYRGGKRSVVYSLPTGGGKTVLFAFMVQRAAERGKRVLILAHRRELVFQASRTLTELGVEHGIIMPGQPRTDHPIQIAMVQTARNRLAKDPTSLRADFVVVDEAHHTAATTYRAILNVLPQAYILGVTATPSRPDGKGLAETYQVLVQGPGMRRLIDRGALCDYRLFVPPSDIRDQLKRIPIRHGDYHHGLLEEEVNKPKITGDAIEHYQRICPGTRAAVFCVSVKHAQAVAQQFRDAGIPAESIDGRMRTDKRVGILARFERGETKVLTSCDLISEGFDLPALEAAILLRPTKSIVVYLQQVGRALRPAPDKANAIILDHVHNSLEHGLPDHPRLWSLEGNKREKSTVDLIICKKCFCAYPANLPRCPYCYKAREGGDRKVGQVDGQLVEITPQIQAKKRLMEWIETMHQGGYRVGMMPSGEYVALRLDRVRGRKGVYVRRPDTPRVEFLALNDIYDMGLAKSVGKILKYKPGWAQRVWFWNHYKRSPNEQEIWHARREYRNAQ